MIRVRSSTLTLPSFVWHVIRDGHCDICATEQGVAPVILYPKQQSPIRETSSLSSASISLMLASFQRKPSKPNKAMSVCNAWACLTPFWLRCQCEPNGKRCTPEQEISTPQNFAGAFRAGCRHWLVAGDALAQVPMSMKLFFHSPDILHNRGPFLINH